MHNRTTTRVNSAIGHDNFTTYVADFPDLKYNTTIYNPELSPYDQARVDLIKNSLNQENVKKLHCISICKKLESPNYLEFCLQRKCNMNLKEAQSFLESLK